MKPRLDEYYKMTGQFSTELFAGASQVGLSYILDELVPMAIEERKKIVWIDEDLDTGRGHYELQDLE